MVKILNSEDISSLFTGANEQNSLFEREVVVLDLNLMPLKQKLALKNTIIKHGGQISFVINRKCTLLVTNLEGSPSRLQMASKFGIPAVSSEYIGNCVEQKQRIKLESYLIDNMLRQEAFLQGKILECGNFTKENKIKMKFSKILSTEPYEELTNYHLLKAVVLKGNQDNYFIIELHYSPIKFCIVTQESQGQLKSRYTTEKDVALSNYSKLYIQKINYPLQMVPVWEKIPTELGSSAFKKWFYSSGSTNLLALQLVDYLWMESYNQLSDNLESVLEDYTIQQIDEGEAILLELQEEIINNGSQIQKLAKAFYDVLKHKKPGTLDSIKQVVEKLDLCQVLKDNLLVNEGTKSGLVDSRYRALGCHIIPVPKDSLEYQNAATIIQTTDSNESHLNILNVYKIEREIETIRFSTLPNTQLLFHTTAPSNLIGILSRGLLASKEAKYLRGSELRERGNFGSGIYFSSSTSYCAHFSKASTIVGKRYILVCEVALGEVYETHEPQPGFLQPPEGFDSVKGIKGERFKEDEFVIYSTNQQKLLYIIEFSLPNDKINLSAKPPTIPEPKPFKSQNQSTLFRNKKSQELNKPKPGVHLANGDILPLKEFHIRSKLIDLASKTTLFQVFENPNDFAIEAKFVFVLEAGSSVCGFEVFINNKHLISHVEEKSQARAEYNQAIQKGHGGYLLDQEFPDVFSISLGNLPPSTSVLIKIVYVCELLVDESGSIKFNIPSVVSSSQEYQVFKSKTQEELPTSAIRMTEEQTKFSLLLSLEMPFNIKHLNSPTHELLIKKTDTKAVVKLKDDAKLGKNGFTLLVAMSQIHVPRMWVERDAINEDEYACMLTFYPEFQTRELEDLQIILLLDMSNSMKGSTFKESRSITLGLLDLLPTNCQFNIIAFGTIFRECFASNSDCSPENVDIAKLFINNLKPNMGRSELHRPLKCINTLTSSKLANIVVISDGLINDKEQVLKEAFENRNKIRIFTIGVGELSDKHFLKHLTYVGVGHYEQMSRQTSSTNKLKQLIDKCSQSAISQVNVDWQHDGSKPVHQAPKLITSLFNGERLVIYGFVHKCYLATLKVTINGYEYQTVVSTPLSMNTSGSLLHTLTAKALVDDWLNGLMDTNASNKILLCNKSKLKMIKLCKSYNLVSSLTSFVAVEKRGLLEQSDAARAIEAIVKEQLQKEDSIDVLNSMPFVGEKNEQQIKRSKFDDVRDLMKETETLSSRQVLFSAKISAVQQPPAPILPNSIFKTAQYIPDAQAFPPLPGVSINAMSPGSSIFGSVNAVPASNLFSNAGIGTSTTLPPPASILPTATFGSFPHMPAAPPLPASILPATTFDSAPNMSVANTFSSPPGVAMNKMSSGALLFGSARKMPPAPKIFSSPGVINKRSSGAPPTFGFGNVLSSIPASNLFSSAENSGDMSFGMPQACVAPQGFLMKQSSKPSIPVPQPQEPVFELMDALVMETEEAMMDLDVAYSPAEPQALKMQRSAPTACRRKAKKKKGFILDFSPERDMAANSDEGTTEEDPYSMLRAAGLFPSEMEFKKVTNMDDVMEQSESLDESEVRMEKIAQLLMKKKDSQLSASKASVRKFIQDNYGFMGGVPFCEAIHKKTTSTYSFENSNFNIHIDELEINDELKWLTTFHNVSKKCWILDNIFEANILDKSIIDVLNSKGLNSYGTEIYHTTLQLVTNIAVILYLLSCYLANSPETAIDKMIEDCCLYQESKYIMQTNKDIPLIYSSLGLGNNWESFILEYLNIPN